MHHDVLILLQNAWSPFYAGGIWPRESWLRALWRSRTGQRVQRLIERCPGVSFWIDETTPIVGATSGSVVPPDYCYLQTILATVQPGLIVACGNQAADAIAVLRRRAVTAVPLVILPHPAYRLTRNATYDAAAPLVAAYANGSARVVDLLDLRQRAATV